MTVAPDERLERLRHQLRGYDPEAVGIVLREVHAARRALERECAELRGRVDGLRREVEERDELDRRIRQVLVDAQRDADELRARTAREVEELRLGAESLRAGLDERAVDEEAARIRAEIDRLRRLESEVRGAARALLSEALRRLDDPAAGPAPAAAPVAEAAPDDPASAEEEERPAAAGAASALLESPAPPDDTVDVPTAPAPEPPAPPPPPPPRPEPAVEPPRRRRSLRLSIALAAGILALGAGVATLVWQLREDETTDTTPPAITARTAPGAAGGETQQPAGGAAEETPATTAEPAAADDEPAEPPAETAEAPQETAGATTASGTGATESAPAPPRTAALVLRATGGDCWLSVRRGSASGTLLYEGFLFDGETRRFEGRRLWVRVGNPSNLVARVNGRQVELPAGTADVLFTPAGSQTLALG